MNFAFPQASTTARRTHRSASRGLTLIELVVVIAILAVLGGLAVQAFPSLMKRTHLSKCADTIAALNKTWGESYAMYGRYPSRCDSLLAAGGGTIYDKLTPGLSALVSPTALSEPEARALASIGVTSVVDLAADVSDVTYKCAPLGTTTRALNSGANVALLQTPGTGTSVYWAANPLGLKRHLEATNGATVKYVVFGIGPNCSAVGAGKLLQEAPVHFGADDTINPAKVYQRYLAVYALTTKTDGTVTASFDAATGNDTNGPSSAEDHVRQFFEAQATDVD